MMLLLLLLLLVVVVVEGVGIISRSCVVELTRQTRCATMMMMVLLARVGPRKGAKQRRDARAVHAQLLGPLLLTPVFVYVCVAG
jgi:hypothetical protein